MPAIGACVSSVVGISIGESTRNASRVPTQEGPSAIRGNPSVDGLLRVLKRRRHTHEAHPKRMLGRRYVQVDREADLAEKLTQGPRLS
jgi:hypothetical protein